MAAEQGRVRRAAAARRGPGPGGNRTLREEEHGAPWETGNTNLKGAMEAQQLNREKNRLNKLGIDIEEFKEFFLDEKYQTDDVEITQMNTNIVKKLNGIRVLRVQYQEEVSMGVPSGDTVVTKNGILNLKTQVEKLQAAIKSRRGLAYPTPEGFFKVVGM